MHKFLERKCIMKARPLNAWQFHKFPVNTESRPNTNVSCRNSSKYGLRLVRKQTIIFKKACCFRYKSSQSAGDEGFIREEKFPPDSVLWVGPWLLKIQSFGRRRFAKVWVSVVRSAACTTSSDEQVPEQTDVHSRASALWYRLLLYFYFSRERAVTMDTKGKTGKRNESGKKLMPIAGV